MRALDATCTLHVQDQQLRVRVKDALGEAAQLVVVQMAVIQHAASVRHLCACESLHAEAAYSLVSFKLESKMPAGRLVSALWLNSLAVIASE